MTNPEESLPEVGAAAPKVPIKAGYFFVAGLLAFMTIAAAGLLGWLYLVAKPEKLRKQGTSRLPILGTIPDFKLTAADGGEVSIQSLKGKVWIADFIFTSCAGPCLTMSKNMRELQDGLLRIPSAAPRVRFVSITVDPDRDTPEVLSRYGEKYGADPARWMFLTGPYDNIQSLAREGFKLGVTPGNPESNEPIIHAQSFVLIDGEGRIRGYFDGTNGSEVAKLYNAAQRLLREDKT